MTLVCRCNERRLISLVQAGHWEIDEEGRVWRLARRIRHSDRFRSVERARCETMIPSGYLQVGAYLGVEVRARAEYVGAHRLVWQHFHGDIADGLAVNHINGIKTDNRPGNLEVVTASENARHAARTGLWHPHIGERNGGAKLTDAQWVEIVARAAAGERNCDLAAEYGVSREHISRVRHGKRRTSTQEATWTP